GIVAEILDGASAVGVGVGLAKLSGSESGVALEQQRLDGVGPGEVDNRFMGEHSITAGRPAVMLCSPMKRLSTSPGPTPSSRCCSSATPLSLPLSFARPTPTPTADAPSRISATI